MDDLYRDDSLIIEGDGETHSKISGTWKEIQCPPEVLDMLLDLLD